MSYLQFKNLINMINISTTIALASYLVTKLSVFEKAISLKTSQKDQVILGVIFGLISILGTLLGIGYTSDSLMQASIIAPSIAGITAGYLSGLTSGIIGGTYALFTHTLTAKAAFLSCIFSGLWGGFFYHRLKQKRFHFLAGLCMGIVCELFWYCTFLLTNNFSSLSVFYTEFFVPSTLISNPVGIGLILLFLHDINMGKELRGAEYSDSILKIINQSIFKLSGTFQEASAETVVNCIYETAAPGIVGITNFHDIFYERGYIPSSPEKPDFQTPDGLIREMFQKINPTEISYQLVKLSSREFPNMDRQLNDRFLIASPIIVNRSLFAILYCIIEQDFSISPVTQLISGIAALIGKRIQQNYIDEQHKLLVEAEYQTLKAQINPHFLFNTLSVINTLTRIDPQEAQQVIMNLASFFRCTLNAKESIAPLSRELEICSFYLGIQKTRYKDLLLVLIDVSPDCEDILIPSFTIQPLVENSFKHGQTPPDSQLRLGIWAQIEENKLVIVVQDNGGGFPTEILESLKSNETPAGFGIGLININRRLKILFGDNYSMLLCNEENGAKVELRIPIDINTEMRDNE